MTPCGEQIRTELRLLRHHGGVTAVSLIDRLGPLLRTAFAVVAGDEPDAVRRRVTAELTELVRGLPERRERVAVVEVYGLAGSAPAKVGERLERAAEKLDDVSGRTVRRWLEDAEERMAEVLAGRAARRRADNPHSPPGWFVSRLSSQVRLDLPRPELIERREIVATDDGTDHLTVSLSIPQLDRERPAKIEAFAVAGCAIAASEHPHSSNWRFRLELPHPLRAGERHRYEIAFRLSDLALMRPYYVLVPLRHCQYFEAEVHFGSPPVADLVWRLDGVPTSVLDDMDPGEHRLEPGEAGAVRVAFDHPSQGMAYGVQWSWREMAVRQ